MKKTETISRNSKVKDSGSRIIFRNPELCSQLLRGYTDMLFMISLIEHKSYVDYNVIMQLLRYMVYIWEDYEKDMERQHKGISKSKDFKYPPILPIVYYEGAKKWTAACHLRDRILLPDVFAPYLPDFSYKLIQLNDYSRKELTEKKDDLSLVMMINQIQSIDDFSKLDLPEEYLQNLSENTPAYLKDIVVDVVAGLLRHLHIPEQEILDFTGQVKEQKMGMLFENFKDFDFPAEMKKAREEARTEGRERLLIELVCRKLRKGKGALEIAEDLEEEKERIEEIVKAAETFVPEYDAGKIWDAMRSKE